MHVSAIAGTIGVLAALSAHAQPVPPRGYALRFGQGIRDDFVQIADSPSIRPQELTIELWVRPDSLLPEYHLFGKAYGAASADSYVMWTRNGGVEFRFACNSAGSPNSIPNPLEIGRWMHIAGVSSATTRELWIDGVLRDTSTGGLQSTYGNHPFLIGSDINRGSTSGFFHGAIDEVRLWDHPRSGAQIRANMSRSLTGSEAGLLGYWSFDDGAGQFAFDASPFGNLGILGANANPAGDPGDPEWVAVCYADCDWSTGPGRLDIFDFLCFQNRFIAMDSFACDCEVISGPGVCDIFDFLCFQNRFIAGCE